MLSHYIVHGLHTLVLRRRTLHDSIVEIKELKVLIFICEIFLLILYFLIIILFISN